jgi:hypothetical protein
MSHDPTKVLLGSSASSDRDVSSYASSPATFKAGLAVRLDTDGALTLTKGSPVKQWVGVSAGKDLSDVSKTAVIRSGLGVPIKLADVGAQAVGVVEITSYANLVTAGDDTLTIGDFTFVFKADADAEEPLEVLCAASGSSNAVVATALAAKINAHPELSLLVEAAADSAEVTITALEDGEAGNLALVYSDEGTDTIGLTVSDATMEGGVDNYGYVAIGAPVWIDDATGLATAEDSGVTVSAGVYRSLALDGIEEDGTIHKAALIDIGGGL